MHLDPFSGHGPAWSQGEVRPFTRPALHDSLDLAESCALGPTKPLSARVREGFSSRVLLVCFDSTRWQPMQVQDECGNPGMSVGARDTGSKQSRLLSLDRSASQS